MVNTAQQRRSPHDLPQFSMPQPLSPAGGQACGCGILAGPNLNVHVQNVIQQLVVSGVWHGLGESVMGRQHWQGLPAPGRPYNVGGLGKDQPQGNLAAQKQQHSGLAAQANVVPSRDHVNYSTSQYNLFKIKY